MIQDILQQPYDRSKWTSLLTEVFPNVSILREPQRLEEPGIDFVRDAYQLGNVRLEDGKNLAIFEVCVDGKVQLTRNRVALRDLIAKRIDLGTTHGVLCVFNSSDPEFRFTFVCKETTIDESGQIETQETNSKRFTYILGPGETRRTAAQRFQELQVHRDHAGIKEIVEAFSVERLNKEFFDKYKEHYVAFVDHLIQDQDVPAKIFGVTADPDSDGYVNACKPVRDWVKKLLGRIVFIYFIQKKGWMGCKPSSKAWKDGDPDFLKTFFISAKDKQHFYSKFLVPLFFEALNTPDRVGDIFDLTGTKVPYLNGGLFDESEEKTRKLNFPEHLFKNLFEFFSSYNFTIDENDPEEHEVGIDPEMLGHIFENLLEENKDKGAYYTPKPVVQFMCQQSLLLYLKTHLGDQEGLEKLVRQKDPGDNSKGNWIRHNASRIEELLDKVTICDPAIGSGAFPMGILHEIFWIKLVLDWTLNDPAKFAEIKRRIIEHTIHGVDLDAGAVEIARLRCWLSLVVDEVVPRALPNLEFKIHCANSVIEFMRGEPVDFLKHETLNPDAQRHIKELEGAKTALFEANRKQEKRAARLVIYKAITELGKLEFTWMKKKEGLFSSDRTVELDTVLKELNLYSKQLATAQKLSAKEQDELLLKTQQWFQDRDKPTFAWRIHFAEVFSNGGFDIALGNPPYIRSEALTPIDKAILDRKFETYNKGSDLYIAFFGLALELLKKDGVLTYITSNKYHRGGYGKSLRNHLSINTQIDWIVDFDNAPVFKDLAAYPCIFISRNKFIKNNKIRFLSWDQKTGPIVTPSFLARPHRELDQSSLEIDGWTLSSNNEQKVTAKIQKNGKRLESIWPDSIYYGVKTGCNKAFIISDKVRNDIISKDENSYKVIHKCVRGRDVKKWILEYDNTWLIFIPRGESVEQYPAIKNYLNIFKEQLEPKPADWPSEKKWGGRKSGSYKWYELQDPVKYVNKFRMNKVVCPTLISEASFAVDEKSFLGNDKTTIIVSANPLVLACLLNSKPIWWQLTKIAQTRQNGYYEIKPVYLRRLFFPKINGQEEGELQKLGLSVLKAIESGDGNQQKIIEEKIDLFVANLFGLDEGDISIINSL
jgi:hypothetical protein